LGWGKPAEQLQKTITPRFSDFGGGKTLGKTQQTNNTTFWGIWGRQNLKEKQQ
jgi:hypothetical protein